MIQVSYNRTHCRLTVTGHAQTAPKGEDLVCAAASILARTAAANAEHLRLTGAARSTIVRLADGDAEIAVTPVHRHRATCQMVMEAVAVGFEILANGAPGIVEYEVMG